MEKGESKQNGEGGEAPEWGKRRASLGVPFQLLSSPPVPCPALVLHNLVVTAERPVYLLRGLRWHQR